MRPSPGAAMPPAPMRPAPPPHRARPGRARPAGAVRPRCPRPTEPRSSAAAGRRAPSAVMARCRRPAGLSSAARRPPRRAAPSSPSPATSPCSAPRGRARVIRRKGVGAAIEPCRAPARGGGHRRRLACRPRPRDRPGQRRGADPHAALGMGRPRRPRSSPAAAHAGQLSGPVPRKCSAR